MSLNEVSISTLLSEKSASVFCVTEETSIEQAVSEMNRQHIGSIVVKKGSSVCGIFTECDVLIRVVSVGRDPRATKLRELMPESFYLNLPYCTSV
jgi:CBS domain-containing protein